MDRSRYAELFLSESREHISLMNGLLLRLEESPADAGAVEELFRSVHTVKGMSAAMGYARSAGLAHALEHALETVRRGALVVDGETVDRFLEAVDALERAIADEAGGPRAAADGPPEGEPAPVRPAGSPATRDPSPASGAVGEARGSLVRIGEERLDRLVDGVGEMVVARDRLRRIAGAREDAELAEVADLLSALVGEVRDEVMSLRTAPVGEVFERFPRLVRDAARTLDRRVSLVVAGAEVRLDRSLLNVLADLLVHLLRNAVDHGIEDPAERLAAGKPPTGEIRLSAARERSEVVVRVEDDGRGIRRDRVLETARARGWREAEAGVVSDAELQELITRPGFSTAERVTGLSGRGVGLDVVGSRALALGGSLRVESEEGKGSRFTLRLPITLSIERSLLLEVAGEPLALPIRAVVELCETTPDALETDGGAAYLRHRGERLPLVALHALWGEEPERLSAWTPVVVVEGPDGRFGCLADALRGQVEAVVKPFDAPRGAIPAFSGATLLSDGRIALILDVARLAAWAASSDPRKATETVC